MLDLCDGLNDAELFLSKNDKLHGIKVRKTGELKKTGPLSRIALSAEMNNKDILLHDYSQHVARKVFFAEKKYQMTRTQKCNFLGVIHILLTPLYCLFYSFSKIGMACNSTCGGTSPPPYITYLAVPVNQLKNQAIAYMIMIVSIIHSLRSDKQGELEKRDIVSIVMVLGFMMIDLEHMQSLSWLENTGYSFKDLLDRTMNKIKGFLGNGFYSYRFVGHITYVCGCLLKVSVGKQSCEEEEMMDLTPCTLRSFGVCLQDGV